MTKPEQGRAAPFGVLLIDKPAGPTSHDVVGWVRFVLRERSVGHCGTLDPAATGLLVVCVGSATKLVEHLTSVRKRYVARFVLGRSTTTADREGETLEQLDELPADAVDRALVELGGLIGELELPPPAYSAIKIAGRRAHDLARAGELVELPNRPMAVDHLEILDRGPDWIDVDLTVTKGTYIRSLAEELGRRLGVPAHMGALHRLACGALGLDDPLAVSGLVPTQLPAREGQAPRWRIGFGDDDRERAVAILQTCLVEPWRRLPFPFTVLTDPDADPILARLVQGQPIRLDPAIETILGLGPRLDSELHALVDRAGGRMILVRRDPEHDRIAPIRLLRF